MHGTQDRHRPRAAGPLDADPPTDADLWPSVARGDHAAFTVLFERHAQRVWNYTYRLTASWPQADDLTAAVFSTLWRRRADVRLVDGSALPWLLTVASNLSKNERRRVARFLRAMPRLAVDDARPDHAEVLAEDAAAHARLERVLAAVRRLPRAERQAVELCGLGRLPVADAAALLGIAEASVRSRLSRARTRLRALTEEDRHDQ